MNRDDQLYHKIAFDDAEWALIVVHGTLLILIDRGALSDDRRNGLNFEVDDEDDDCHIRKGSFSNVSI